jgi:hypothetical protein
MKVVPDEPAAGPNPDKLTSEQPVEDQSGRLAQGADSPKTPQPKGAEDIYGETWIDRS